MKTILLGITGGIAAYKSAELVRLLKKAGYGVHVAMTPAATEFVGPVTFQALSGNPVFTDLWDGRMSNGMAHIDLSRQCDAMLVAPATADFLAKLAHGHASDLLSTLALARSCPLFVAPAMNMQMWQNPATQRNMAQLVADGVGIFGPGNGEQACGEVGMGRMLEPEQLFAALQAQLTPQVLKNKTVLITAGPTFEPIDPVRGITNRSSGKMGYAIAAAASNAGANVILVSGPTALPAPWGVKRVDVTTAEQMMAACRQDIENADVFIGVAAVADYKVANTSNQKRKKSEGGLDGLQFELNPDILATVGEIKRTRKNKPLFSVGFAAETQSVEAYAEKKRIAKNCDWVLGNVAQDTLGAEDVALLLVSKSGTVELPRLTKVLAAQSLITELAKAL
ncbi:MAG: bifunctional phosphopantothenoylcysteine decarboxylase/phosphopantothenate--cysteine ligase CoaBC [Burkholderiales bacterium]|jgi:phosphopantothenoylcysteine decarboxylase/phosphopantothenate--cysteine ligase|nr:bifunctional phosphopantothenoylcysteine decarboxylase/phosphopantothenate--cysteine ligase CoaBC [Burkholderiales bacterium]